MRWNGCWGPISAGSATTAIDSGPRWFSTSGMTGGSPRVPGRTRASLRAGRERESHGTAPMRASMTDGTNGSANVGQARKLSHRGGRIRVVHLVLSVDFAGLEMVVYDLARGMDRSRFEPHVVCLRSPGGLADRFHAAGIPFHSLDCRELPKVRTLFKLTRLLRRLRPHVLHTHNPSPHMFGMLAAPLAEVPVLVHTKHGRNYPHKPRAVFVNRVAALLTDC